MAINKREDLAKIALESFIELDKIFPPTKWNSLIPQPAIAPTHHVYSQTTFGMTRYQQPQNPVAYQVINQVYNPQASFQAQENVKVVAYYQTNTRPYALQSSRVPLAAPPPRNLRASASKTTEKPKVMRSGGMLLFGFPKRNK